MNVVIYSTPTCGNCRIAKNYFKSLGIVYTEINVANNEELAEELIRKTGQYGVPVIEIDGKIIVGMNKAKIDEALKK
jgi:glutaredoxin 3